MNVVDDLTCRSPTSESYFYTDRYWSYRYYPYHHLYKLYKPIDPYIPESRFTPLSSISAIDPVIVDEIRQGYWGWWTSYQAEEIQSTFIEQRLIEELVIPLDARAEEQALYGISWVDMVDQQKKSRRGPKWIKTPAAALYVMLRDKLQMESECESVLGRIRSCLIKYKRKSISDSSVAATLHEPNAEDPSRRTSGDSLVTNDSVEKEKTNLLVRKPAFKDKLIERFANGWRRLSNWSLRA